MPLIDHGTELAMEIERSMLGHDISISQKTDTQNMQAIMRKDTIEHDHQINAQFSL